MIKKLTLYKLLAGVLLNLILLSTTYAQDNTRTRIILSEDPISIEETNSVLRNLTEGERVVLITSAGAKNLRVESAKETSSGRLTILKGSKDDAKFLVHNNGAIVGSVEISGRTYQFVNGRLTEVVEEACQDILTSSDLTSHKEERFPEEEAGQMEVALASSDPIEIWVGKVVSPLVNYYVGGQSAAEALIDLAMITSNEVAENSNLNLRFRTAFVYHPWSNFGLYSLQEQNDGVVDEIGAMRTLYGADTIMGINTSSGGVAFLMTSPPSTSFSPWAYGTVGYQSLSSYTFTHELAHNMGAHHDHPNASGAGAFDFSYGFRDPISNAWGTVMAYGQNRIPYFSNPYLDYNGQPIGIPASMPFAAHNGGDGGTLDLTASIVSNFKCTPIMHYGEGIIRTQGYELDFNAQLIDDATNLKLTLVGEPNKNVTLLKGTGRDTDLRNGVLTLVKNGDIIEQGMTNAQGIFQTTVARMPGQYFQAFSRVGGAMRGSNAVMIRNCNGQ